MALRCEAVDEAVEFHDLFAVLFAFVNELRHIDSDGLELWA